MESREACLTFRIIGREIHEHADAPHPLALLRARRKRPRRRAAATGPSLVLMVASGELLFRC